MASNPQPRGQNGESRHAGRCGSEILEFIFEPGFSTAATVCYLSGRGVGMDVVRRNVTRLRGTVDHSDVA